MFLLGHLIEHNRYYNFFGIAFILMLAAWCSKNRAAINKLLVLKALLLQGVIAFFVLKIGIGQKMVQTIAHGVAQLYTFGQVGTGFLFGNLINADGPWGFVFGLKILPIIIFFGAFMALLFHWGIIQWIVYYINRLFQPLLGTSGAETLCAISNSFLGQTEAPLVVRNYLEGMTKSELFVVMVSGMGTISGAILAVFAAMGVPAAHMLAASVMAIPSTILIAKIMYPETEQPQTAEQAPVTRQVSTTNFLGAIASGTTDGLHLAINVGAMLISFLSLLALVNGLFSLVGLSLNQVFSYIFAPFGYLMGFSGPQALQVGQLLGTKVVLNELLAYCDMIKMQLDERTVSIVTYALCGFSNFSCIGIQIGGIGVLVPSKKSWLIELGIWAVVGGALSNLLSAMIAGLLI